MKRISTNLSLILNTVILYFVIINLSSVTDLYGQNDFKKIKVNNDIELTQIKESFYMHTSWSNTETFGRVPSNGLIFVKGNKALIIDTPMDDSLTRELYNYLLDSMNFTVETLIAGHSHSDCMGGINYLHSKNVHSIALNLTNEKCVQEKLPLPKQVFTDSLIFDFYGEKIICKYFGPGHTSDNIVVYFPMSRVLFGGCMIKSLKSNNLGYTGEAVIDQWDLSVEKVKNAFTDVEFIIPGHGSFGDKKLLDRTIELVKAEKMKKK